MSRKRRIEYPGAMYHVMNREDQREGAGERLWELKIRLVIHPKERVMAEL
jgi:hypothetical protein